MRRERNAAEYPEPFQHRAASSGSNIAHIPLRLEQARQYVLGINEVHIRVGLLCGVSRHEKRIDHLHIVDTVHIRQPFS